MKLTETVVGVPMATVAALHVDQGGSLLSSSKSNSQLPAPAKMKPRIISPDKPDTLQDAHTWFREQATLRQKWKDNLRYMEYNLHAACEKKCSEAGRPCEIYQAMEEMHKKNQGTFASMIKK